MENIARVSRKTATEMIEKRKPLGLFYTKHNEFCFVGIDNSDGNAWTEEFISENDCIKWLNGKEVNELDKNPTKNRVIESVIVIHQYSGGPEYLEVGRELNGKKIADIILNDERNTIWVFDEDEEVMVEIRNCPVVVYYKDAENEE